MILNDKPNCQVSRILMSPRPILSDSSENFPKFELNLNCNFGEFLDEMSNKIDK
jgi:hypothetical protein